MGYALDRIVAVKISTEQFFKRFEREAGAVAALNQPHICISTTWRQNLVMEYIEGQSVKGPLSLHQMVRYGAQYAVRSMLPTEKASSFIAI